MKVVTPISEEDKTRLNNKWKPFAFTIGEESPTASGDGREYSYEKLCPEVGFEVFGYFSSAFNRYSDELDLESAHNRLLREHADRSDPHWRWSSIAPLHYTQCREYSIHSDISAERINKAVKARAGLSPKIRWQVLARDNFFANIAGGGHLRLHLRLTTKFLLSTVEATTSITSFPLAWTATEAKELRIPVSRSDKNVVGSNTI